MLASDRLFCLREKTGSYLSKLRRDFIGADFQPSRLTKSEANLLSRATFMIFPIFTVEFLDRNGLKYYQKVIDWRDDPIFYKYWV